MRLFVNSEYIIMRPKDKILVDSEIYRDYTVMSGIFKVTKIDTSNNCIDLMIIKFSDRIQLKSNNTYSYVLQALTQSKILGSYTKYNIQDIILS
uniref:Uncharacterized protein n=1 Tax=Porphyridium purpureum TaxID=35688 RepID=W0RZ75_PORPP|nr:hypothetical protein Y721_p118 [Porphyridium purpureum]BAO23690.1 hypothetical protein [Porphyridium purpureum]